MTGVRLDKWLWAARFFKTRTLSARACELNRVSVQDHAAKASRNISPGDVLRVRTDSAEFTVRVLGLSDQRGPASVAQQLYEETEESKAKRAEAAEQRRMMPVFEVLHEGKPSKKDRRRMDNVRERF
ncbi:RNA-binding S4 domain-containing protein [Terriglobus aquaticus]|uniref:RNA-binding S4 domain-containing protein n=1 Tax=Terriglobus aquaticus TaxID=940139 RepID=A0ABW9KK97_9BACT|nr:RNA-binding S4 domain-containing protein [Terriglobus aquaticus]